MLTLDLNIVYLFKQNIASCRRTYFGNPGNLKIDRIIHYPFKLGVCKVVVVWGVLGVKISNVVVEVSCNLYVDGQVEFGSMSNLACTSMKRLRQTR